MVTAFVLLYFWRILFHGVMRRVNLNMRILVLGSRGPAHELANVILEHPQAGFEVAGLVPEPGLTDPLHGEDPDHCDEDPANEPPKLVAPAHAQTVASRALVLEDVDVLERAVTNKGVAMSGGSVAGQGDEKSLLALSRRMHVDMLVIALENRRLTLPIQELLR